MTSAATTSKPFNESKYPMLDRHGQPLAGPCRVRVREAYYHINCRTFTGTLTRIDVYGGMYILADEPQDVHFRGMIVGRRREVYVTLAKFDLAQNVRVAKSTVGDPWEHGQIEIWVERIEGEVELPWTVRHKGCGGVELHHVTMVRQTARITSWKRDGAGRPVPDHHLTWEQDWNHEHRDPDGCYYCGACRQVITQDHVEIVIEERT